MKKSVYVPYIAFALVAFAALPGHEASAQAGGVYVNAVDLDINPADIQKYLAAAKENAAGAITEPGCREFNVHVSAKDPNHVFLYEVYDNAAALEAHRATPHFKKYQAATTGMVAKRDVRAMSPVAFNSKHR